VLEADISGYFDAIVRKELMEMIERRVKDGSILSLIGKWINVGVIDEGRLLKSETGVGQGQVISPLLANLYLHYVLDEWFEQEVKPRRATDQLQEPEEVLSGSPAYLERKSEPPNAREDCHLGEVRADRSKIPVKAAADHTGLGMVSRT
jgi:hypothetical protein